MVVALDGQVDVRVGDGGCSAEGLHVVVAIYFDVVEIVVAIVKSCYVALGKDVLHGAMSVDFSYYGSQLAVVENATQVHATGVNRSLDAVIVFDGLQTYVASIGLYVALGREDLFVALGLAGKVDGAQTLDFLWYFHLAA